MQIMAKEKQLAKEEEQSGEKEKGKIGHLIATILGIVLCAVLLPVVIVNMTLVIKSYTKPEEVPTFLGVAPLIVQSGSMEPTILVDDLIFVRRVDPSKIRAGAKNSENPGTIVAYFASPQGGTVITHRVISIRTAEDGARTYEMQGDFNNAPDENLVRDSQIVGEYFLRVEGAGAVALFMKEPIGMVLFVGIPLGLFVLYDTVRRALFSKKQRKAEQDKIAALEGALAAREKAAGAVPEDKEGSEKA